MIWLDVFGHVAEEGNALCLIATHSDVFFDFCFYLQNILLMVCIRQVKI